MTFYREAAGDPDTDGAFLDEIKATNDEFEANAAHRLAETHGDQKAAEREAAIDMCDPKALAAWSAKHETDPTMHAVALDPLYGPSWTTRSRASRSSSMPSFAADSCGGSSGLALWPALTGFRF